MSISTLSRALVLVPALGCATVAPQEAHPVATSAPLKHVSLLVGERSLDSDDWSPVDDQTVIGFGFDMPLPNFPAEFEAGLFRSHDESGSVEGTTREISAGLRKTFDLGDARFHPYVGGGLSAIRAEVEAPGPDDDDGSLAIYLHGGAGFDLTPNWQIGVDLRFLFGSDIELNGNDMDADYTQFGVYVAYGF